MPSLIPGYEYDIFISYRQKDNKYDGWVTELSKIWEKSLKQRSRKISPFTSTVTFGTPEELFRGEFINVPGYSWDVTRDNEKFLLLQGSSEKTSLHVSVIQGWFEELNRLVPASTKQIYWVRRHVMLSSGCQHNPEIFVASERRYPYNGIPYSRLRLRHLHQLPP